MIVDIADVDVLVVVFVVVLVVLVVLVVSAEKRSHGYSCFQDTFIDFRLVAQNRIQRKVDCCQQNRLVRAEIAVG